MDKDIDPVLFEMTVNIRVLVEQVKALPPSRELSLVRTKLEEAELWVTAHLAEQQNG